MSEYGITIVPSGLAHALPSPSPDILNLILVPPYLFCQNSAKRSALEGIPKPHLSIDSFPGL